VTSPPAWAPEIPSKEDWESWNIDPRWSRLIDVPSHDGTSHRWHVLDTGGSDQQTKSAGTILCVHGNPTWAYAWASFLRDLGARFRVIAVDQLGMGYSDRTVQRRYVDRVRDLDDVIKALDVDTKIPLVLAAHDWGGAIAMGWAVENGDRVSGMILSNTGIAVPEGREAPRIIRLAASAPLLDFVCRGTPMFVEGTIRLSRSRITALDRQAFRAPYKTAPSRVAIADFVDDIPLHSGDPSEAALADVADRLGGLKVPILLAWGSNDPVFNDDFATDLANRFGDVTLHRFPSANHLVMAEADVSTVAYTWLTDLLADRLIERDRQAPSGPRDARSASLWTDLDARRSDDGTAFVDLATGDSVTFADFLQRVDSVAADLVRRGLEPGDRVAMLTPPGVDLVAAVYGVWRARGVTVVADRGLGLSGLGAAVRGSSPKWVIGPRKALAAATTMRWAPRATRLNIADLVAAELGDLPELPSSGDDAAVLFTSGATGPAKGVRYLHGQLAAQRDALAATYGITDNDRLVAAFAPFALYGPALGVPTALPDCDVTKPSELTAGTLDEACRRIGATMVFASPSALANVIATASEMGEYPGLEALRVVFSAGAPVPSETLHAMSELAPEASLHTPYGMTEALPVADINLDQIDQAEADDPFGGVCVGWPVKGAKLRIASLAFDPETTPDEIPIGETGEILVSAPWVSEGYFRLWAVERAARPTSRLGGSDELDPDRWHRTGDVGHVDTEGRLWVEGRFVHLISSSRGPISPVPVERVVERGLGTVRVAAVGVGPEDRQQLVIVLEDDDADIGLASPQVTARVRELVAEPVAAVLSLHRAPVDIRHNAKIDRAAVAAWAADVLAGRRAKAPK
jgi:acyl-CoA synthetase (AMP-forming)/AMP-acid ligase II/pimeloyl-ACP methyl ester carboxylesterase